jgi:hypothetical protein
MQNARKSGPSRLYPLLTKALATMPDDTVIDGEIVVQVKLHQSTSGRQAGST